MVSSELSRTMAYTTHRTVNRLKQVRKQVDLNHVCQNDQRRNKPIYDRARET